GNALNNVLEGNVGDDILIGGGGNDTFVFRAGFGHDAIEDFHGGVGPSDQIALLGFEDVTTFDDVLAHAIQDGTNVVIDLGENNHLVLKDVVLATLAADDFRFA